MIGLTPRQRDCLRFLRACQPECPTYEEMRLALNLKAKSAVHHLVVGLEQRGHLRRLPHRACAIEVLDSPQPIIIRGKPYRFIPKTKAAHHPAPCRTGDVA